MNLPPRETAQLDQHLLQLPSTSASRSTSWLPVANFSFTLPSFSFSTNTVLTGVAFLALPVGLFFLAQPYSPSLNKRSEQAMTAYLQEQRQNAVAQAKTAPPSAEAEVAGASTVDAELASSEPSSSAYQYQITLSQGFLNKAITLSQSTKDQVQSDTEKETIRQYLTQALDAVNKAIELDASNGTGFYVRARIYKISSVIKPELAELSQQDIEIARALGIDDQTLKNDNVLQYIPTQQATELASAPIVADAEEGDDTTVTSETNDNAIVSTSVLPAGAQEVFVELPSLTANMSVSVSVAPNAPFKPHGVFTIKSRENGKGFTLQSDRSYTEQVLLEWRAVSE